MHQVIHNNRIYSRKEVKATTQLSFVCLPPVLYVIPVTFWV